MEKQPHFEPKLTQTEALQYSERYKSSEDDAALKAGEAIRNGDYSRVHLNAIFKWKTGDRGKSRIKKNSDEEIVDVLKLAMNAQTPRAAVAVLCGLQGVQIPVASAILTAAHPDRYTIIDYRALEALGVETSDRSLGMYLCYLSFCMRLAAQWEISPRQLDRALWQWSLEQQDTKKK